MRFRAVAVTVLLVLTLVLAACGDDGGGEDADDKPSGDRAADIAASVESGEGLPDGAELYAQSCATCHGTDGQGAIGPQLTGVADKMTLPDHVNVVLNGRAGMPGWGSTLEDDEIAAIIKYEREGL